MKYKALFNLSRYDDKDVEIWRVKAGETFEAAEVPDLDDLIKCGVVHPVTEPPKELKRPKAAVTVEV